MIDGLLCARFVATHFASAPAGMGDGRQDWSGLTRDRFRVSGVMLLPAPSDHCWCDGAYSRHLPARKYYCRNTVSPAVGLSPILAHWISEPVSVEADHFTRAEEVVLCAASSPCRRTGVF